MGGKQSHCGQAHVVQVGEQELWRYEAILITFCGVLSALFNLGYLITYFGYKSPWSRRHPGSLVAMRCIAEFVWSMIFVITPFGNIQMTDEDEDFNEHYPKIDDEEHIFGESGLYAYLSWQRRPKTVLKFMVFLVEWSLLSSELWFFCLGHDWHTSMSQPFVSFKSYRRYYQVLSFGLPVIMGLIAGYSNLVSKGVAFFFIPWVVPDCAEQMTLRFDLHDHTLLYGGTKNGHNWGEKWKNGDDDASPYPLYQKAVQDSGGNPSKRKFPLYWARPFDQIKVTSVDDDHEFAGPGWDDDKQQEWKSYMKKTFPWPSVNEHDSAYSRNFDDDEKIIRRQWGPRDDENINVPHQFDCTTFFPPNSWPFLFAFIIVIYAYNLAVVAYGQRRLNRGMSNSQEQRKMSLYRSKFLVISTCIYWTIPLIFMMIISNNAFDKTTDDPNVIGINHCSHHTSYIYDDNIQ
jgi:hypothetical protein